MRRFVCRGCQAEYTGHAEYCNHCGGTDFAVEGGEAAHPPALRSNPTALWAIGLSWLAYTLYIVAARRERDPADLFQWWLIGAGVSLVLGFVTRHPRAVALFTLVAGAFLALAGLLGR